MKILIVNTSDIIGGAARGAYRLHRALLDSGIESKMLVQNKTGDDYTVIGPPNNVKRLFNIVKPAIDRVPKQLYNKQTKTMFSVSWFPFSNIVKNINALNPDIVNLHWICGGMIRIEDIARINAPVVWTLQDMWAFTGGCHYDEECGLYEGSCGSCRVLNSKRKNDLSRKILKRKKKIYSNIKNLQVVALSNWLNDCAAKSIVFRNRKITTIPNPIHTDIYKPLDKPAARDLWGLPHNKKLVLFGAINAVSDPRKGFEKLTGALHKLTDPNIELVIFGSGKPEQDEQFGFKTHYMGHLNDDISLAALYSAVDVMIVPSLQEAQGQTATEAMACGTPVVAFAKDGLIDIIDHEINGYLSAPFDTSDLAKGITWVLNNSNYESICREARNKILSVFSSRIIAESYIELFNKILHND